MIKNVIFDLGGVILRFQPKEEIKKLNLSKEKAERLYKCIFQDPLWQEMDEGKYVGLSQTLPLYLQKYPDMHDEIIAFFHKDWEAMLSVRDEGKAFFEKVKNHGYKCYILSNYHVATFAYTEKKYASLFAEFDGKVISGQIQKWKPNADIYAYLIDTYGLKKEECVFFDDTKTNVDAAEQFGIRSFVYTDAKTAWKDLQSVQ